MSEKAKINSTSSAHEAMLPRWKMARSLLGGTATMRAAGEEFLPRFPAESQQEYRDRQKRTVLLNYYGETVENLAARPFSEKVQLGEAFPEELKALEEDVDLQGNDLTAFSLQVFKAGLADGLTHILVDYTKVDPAKVKTLADEKAVGARPWFVHVLAEDVLAAYCETIKGVETLTHLRIRQCSVERDGFDERRVYRIRIYEPTWWQVWKSLDEKEWTKEDEGPLTIGTVALATFYADRESFMVARPPLTDLAYKNVEHWQSSSDQRNILTVTRFPILAVAGMSGDDAAKVKLSPHALLATDNPQGKFYYVEHNGAAIDAGQKDLQTIEEHMAMLGADLLVRKGSGATQTATEKSINTQQASSKLQRMAEAFADTLETAFAFAAKWLNLTVDDKALQVTVHTDFGIEPGAGADIELLYKARVSREISRSTFLAELKRRRVLAATFDPETDQAAIDEEGPALGSMRALPPGTPPAPGGQPPNPNQKGPPAPGKAA